MVEEGAAEHASPRDFHDQGRRRFLRERAPQFEGEGRQRLGSLDVHRRDEDQFGPSHREIDAITLLVGTNTGRMLRMSWNRALEEDQPRVTGEPLYQLHRRRPEQRPAILGDDLAGWRRPRSSIR